MLFAWRNYIIRMAVVVFAAWCANVSAQLPGMGEIKDFRIPEFDANGVLKSEIYGDVAQPLEDDKIRITGLKIIMYRYQDNERKVEATLTSDRCTIDRKTRNAFSNAEVKIVRGNVVITGRGFRWAADSQRIEILNKFHMVMVGDVKVWPLVKEKN